MNKKQDLLNNCYGYFPAVLLLTSSILKFHYLSSHLLSFNYFVESRGVELFLASFELVLGFWLLSLWNVHIGRWITIGLFSLFFVAATKILVDGKQSCGCFGVVTIHPAITVVLDVIVLISLVCWSPLSQSKFPWRLFFLCFVILATALFHTCKLSVVDLDSSNFNPAKNSLIVVDEKTWIGQDFPIGKYIERPSFPYSVGQVDVVLYHENCRECQRLIAFATKKGGNWLFLEVPPHESPRREDRKGIAWRKLSDDYNWFVSAPAVLHLNEGLVTQVSSGFETDKIE